MEEELKESSHELDNMYRQLMNLKSSKSSKKEEIKELAKELPEKLSSVCDRIEEEMCNENLFSKGPTFNGKAIKPEYSSNYKVMKAVNVIKTLIEMITKE